jgi:hypothetical protein
VFFLRLFVTVLVAVPLCMALGTSTPATFVTALISISAARLAVLACQRSAEPRGYRDAARDPRLLRWRRATTDLESTPDEVGQEEQPRDERADEEIALAILKGLDPPPTAQASDGRIKEGSSGGERGGHA